MRLRVNPSRLLLSQNVLMVTLPLMTFLFYRHCGSSVADIRNLTINKEVAGQAPKYRDRLRKDVCHQTSNFGLPTSQPSTYECNEPENFHNLKTLRGISLN